MSALTQGSSRVTRVKLTPEQIAERRREAEEILGRKLPPHPRPPKSPSRRLRAASITTEHSPLE